MSDKKKIDNRIYNYFDVLAKGNQFKNKRVLLESIHEIMDVRARERYLKEQTEARKGRDRTRIERKAAREQKKIIEREAINAAATTDSQSVI